MRLYGQSLALLTDLYQLTMCYGYWQSGLDKSDAVFHLNFRKNPFQGGFTVACGLEDAIAWLENFRFEDSDLQYLSTLKGSDNEPLFLEDFLEYLRELKLTCDIHAMPEGTIAFPHSPLVRVQGPLIECQLLETPLLNLINFPTLIATKAARICLATQGDSVLEFGLRRAQGIDGGVTASRAAYVGGCSATSNLLAGKLFDIPVRGTHAHSWVMAFEDELDSFQTYAEALPNNCVFLVDTYDTLEGVKKAIEVGNWLRSQGRDMIGIRLDSGDLAYLSMKARKLLDQEGFRDAVIVASNDLDEHIIASLKAQGAPIAVWGVGTRLATAFDQPALGGVYKMSAIRHANEEWRYKVKLSEQAIKVSTPGRLQVRRFSQNDEYVADVVFDEDLGLSDSKMVDPLDPTRRKKLKGDYQQEDLLQPIYREGTLIYSPPPLSEVRDRVQSQLKHFHFGVKRFVNPHSYPVGLEENLHKLKTKLILQARGESENGPTEEA